MALEAKIWQKMIGAAGILALVIFENYLSLESLWTDLDTTYKWARVIPFSILMLPVWFNFILTLASTLEEKFTIKNLLGSLSLGTLAMTILTFFYFIISALASVPLYWIVVKVWRLILFIVSL